MINLSNIRSFYPKQLWGFERFIFREYLQHKILEIIYDSSYANKLIFMGGTALRIIYNNSRFSEDLDFDNINIKESEFGKITALIKNKLEQQGFEIDIRNVYKGAFHCHIKFPGLLKELNLSGHLSERILIRLDTEDQNFDFIPERILINKFDVFTEIFATPKDLLLAQKFYAILNRPRNKGRDFFDVVFLLGLNAKPNYEYLTQKINISTEFELKSQLKKKVQTLNMIEMANDVRPFLFNLTDEKKVLLFDKYIATMKLK